MKIYVISDSLDVITGMRLAGVEGTMIHNAEEAINRLNFASSNKEYGLILVTQGIADKIQQEIREIKLKNSLPVVTVIPDRNIGISENYITDYIKQSIGLKI